MGMDMSKLCKNGHERITKFLVWFDEFLAKFLDSLRRTLVQSFVKINVRSVVGDRGFPVSWKRMSLRKIVNIPVEQSFGLVRDSQQVRGRGTCAVAP